MIRSVLIASLLAIVAFAPGLAVSQSTTAPHPSATDNILYAHHNMTDTTEAAGWMNTLASDPTADDIALGPSGNSWGPTRTFTLTLTPASTSEIKLDKTQPVVMAAYLGAGGGNGAARVTSVLKSGATTVADGAVQNHVYQASTAQYGKLTWSVNPTVDTLPAGEALVWTITATGAGQALFLGVHPDRGTSNITLPITAPAGSGSAPVAPETIYHEETGTEVSASISSDEVTNATHQYNWTGPGGEIAFEYEAEITSGSVSYTIKDASNATAVSGSHDASDAGGSNFESGEAGNVTIEVVLANFSGEFTFNLAPAPEDTSSPTPTTGSTSTTAPKTNTTAATTTTTSEGSTPAAGLVLAMVAVAFAGGITSRRRS